MDQETSEGKRNLNPLTSVTLLLHNRSPWICANDWFCKCLHIAVTALNGSNGVWEELLTHFVEVCAVLMLMPPSGYNTESTHGNICLTLRMRPTKPYHIYSYWQEYVSNISSRRLSWSCNLEIFLRVAAMD